MTVIDAPAIAPSKPESHGHKVDHLCCAYPDCTRALCGYDLSQPKLPGPITGNCDVCLELGVPHETKEPCVECRKRGRT